MTSVIYFKLKNAIQQQHVNFDGSVIQIGDVKHLIAQKQGLGPDGALELTLTDPNTGDEYADDGKVIPRNTLVLVKRTPAARFKPLIAADAATATATQPTAAAATDSLDVAAAGGGDGQPAGGNEFGGDFYSEKPTAAVVGDDESKAMQSFLQGTASTWQREVRQGVMRGRGRGRGGRGAGGVALDYKCPRCDAVGAHWLQDCPTQGDPAYDRKRVRPPVGIPMTRLARSQEGGLVLPDGQTGTLVANEDAFAREILGFGFMSNTQEPASQQEQQTQQHQEAVLALDNKPANISNFASDMTGAMQQQQPPPPSMQPSSLPPSATGPAPKLAGEEDGFGLSGTAAGTGAAAMPGAHLFDIYMRAALLPRGPAQFLEKAYGGAQPLSRSEFERSQDDYRRRYNLPPMKRRRRSRTSSRSRSPSRRRREKEREREQGGGPSRHRTRSRSRSRTRDRSRDRDRDRSKRSSSRRDKDKERERSSERGSRREKEKGRSSREKEREDRSRDRDRTEKEKERKSTREREKKKERTPSVPPLSEIPKDTAAGDGGSAGDDAGVAVAEVGQGRVSSSPLHNQDINDEPELDYNSSDPEEDPETKTKTTETAIEEDNDKSANGRKPIVWPGGGDGGGSKDDARKDKKESSDSRRRDGDDRKRDGDKSSSRRDRGRDSREREREKERDRPSSRSERGRESDRDRSSRREKERDSKERSRGRDSKDKDKDSSRRSRGSSRDQERKRARSAERKEKDAAGAGGGGGNKRERRAPI